MTNTCKVKGNTIVPWVLPSWHKKELKSVQDLGFKSELQPVKQISRKTQRRRLKGSPFWELSFIYSQLLQIDSINSVKDQSNPLKNYTWQSKYYMITDLNDLPHKSFSHVRTFLLARTITKWQKIPAYWAGRHTYNCNHNQSSQKERNEQTSG